MKSYISYGQLLSVDMKKSWHRRNDKNYRPIAILLEEAVAKSIKALNDKGSLFWFVAQASPEKTLCFCASLLFKAFLTSP